MTVDSCELLVVSSALLAVDNLSTAFFCLSLKLLYKATKTILFFILIKYKKTNLKVAFDEILL